MRFASFILTMLPGGALAHTSVVPHAHPHDVSMLPDRLILGAFILLFAVFGLVLRRIWKP